ncbi:hypothetical protein H5410_032424 [Solanum commersonii]|uniref:Uncharacterized protein n=1 Tax=Solanum commersonii TaxID=4109 RepID=A0A9J5YQ98_SOLCO|nr:hypothetical protein H5410_032424 [Solanum commersonii]
MDNKTREVSNEVGELNKEEDSASKQEEIKESHKKNTRSRGNFIGRKIEKKRYKGGRRDRKKYRLGC